jgi:hypothetical protein
MAMRRDVGLVIEYPLPDVRLPMDEADYVGNVLGAQRCAGSLGTKQGHCGDDATVAEKAS